jgi:hypothetical protein
VLSAIALLRARPGTSQTSGAMTRFELLRAKLARDRAAGVPFAEAWERRKLYALPPVSQPRVREENLVVLSATREAWRRAYQGEPPDAGEVAAAELAALLVAVQQRRLDDAEWRPSGRVRGEVVA